MKTMFVVLGTALATTVLFGTPRGANAENDIACLLINGTGACDAG